MCFDHFSDVHIFSIDKLMYHVLRLQIVKILEKNFEFWEDYMLSSGYHDKGPIPVLKTLSLKYQARLCKLTILWVLYNIGWGTGSQYTIAYLKLW